MFTEKDLVFPMSKGNPLEYLNDVLKHEHSFLEYLEGKTEPIDAAYETYASRIKAGASPTETEGLAQVVRYIEGLPATKQKDFMYTIRTELESATEKAVIGLDETTFVFDDKTTQIVDITGNLANSSYSRRNINEKELTGVIIGGKVTAIEPFAFNTCLSLASVAIHDKVTTIGYQAFRNCCALGTIHLPDGITIIEELVFWGCSTLTSVDIPDSVREIRNGAFIRCDSLASIVVPNGVGKIENNTFLGCTSLISVSIPDSVTTIGIRAFHDCKSLTSVTIPNNVTEIGEYAFVNVPHITYHGSAPGAPWGAKSIN